MHGPENVKLHTFCACFDTQTCSDVTGLTCTFTHFVTASRTCEVRPFTGKDVDKDYGTGSSHCIFWDMMPGILGVIYRIIVSLLPL
jgi:hypothetical protein